MHHSPGLKIVRDAQGLVCARAYACARLGCCLQIGKAMRVKLKMSSATLLDRAHVRIKHVVRHSFDLFL